MAGLSMQLADLIRENTATLLTFAFSRQRLEHISEHGLIGEWDTYRETMLELPRARAERAVLELAIHLRHLDDEVGLSHLAEANSNLAFGTLSKRDVADERLNLRAVANKIIHSKAFEWEFTGPDQRPVIVCTPRDRESWTSARIDVLSVTCVCGNLSDVLSTRG